MTLVVVTEHDIMNGSRSLSIDCPVSRAVSRAFGRQMSAGYTSITDGVCESPLPQAIGDWMVRFDQGQPVPRIWFYV
jgi:hypothetical protein